MIRKTCFILLSTYCFLYSVGAAISVAEEVVLDFDDLPALDFVVIEQPDGSTDIIFPDQSVVTIPASIPLELALPPGVTLADLFPPPGEVPESAPLLADYSPYATFSTNDGAGLHYFSGGHYVGSSAPNNITAAVDPDAFPYDQDLYVEFTAPVNFLSFTISSDNDAGLVARVIVHHLEDQMDSIDITGNGDPTDAIPVDLSAYQNVTRIEVVDVTDTYGLSYDDFTFSTVEVPEPLGNGLVLLTLILVPWRWGSSSK